MLVDNQAVVRALTTGVSSSSSHRARAFRDEVDISPWPVEVRWVPGHRGIAANERADCLAKAALRDLAGEGTETHRSHACLARPPGLPGNATKTLSTSDGPTTPPMRIGP